MQIFFDYLPQRKKYISNKQIFCHLNAIKFTKSLTEETIPVFFARFLSRVTDFILQKLTFGDAVVEK